MLDVFELSYLYKDIHLDRLVINYSEKNNCYDVAMISQDMTSNVWNWFLWCVSFYAYDASFYSCYNLSNITKIDKTVEKENNHWWSWPCYQRYDSE